VSKILQIILHLFKIALKVCILFQQINSLPLHDHVGIATLCKFCLYCIIVLYVCVCAVAATPAATTVSAAATAAPTTAAAATLAPTGTYSLPLLLHHADS